MSAAGPPRFEGNHTSTAHARRSNSQKKATSSEADKVAFFCTVKVLL